MKRLTCHLSTALLIGLLLAGLLLAGLLLAGCGPDWTITVSGPGGQEDTINAQTFSALAAFAEEAEGGRIMPLDRALYTFGYRVIAQVRLAAGDEAPQVFAWPEAADGAWLREDGRVLIDGAEHTVTAITVEPDALLDEVEAHLTDIAPTVAAALGLRPPEQASGSALTDRRAAHVLMLFLDGFGTVRFTEARDAGLIPNLAALDPPLFGLTVYPPVTVVASATLLTGADPGVHGVEQRGTRRTDSETIFDVAAEAGLSVVAVEGDALAFEMRSADFTLSGDRDGDGSTDDNVLANALAVLDEGMPDLLWVHFHGIDDAGHTYGPGAAEESAAVAAVDAAVGQLLERLPPDTLVLIFADHGMHIVAGEGDHAHLIARDMYIPVFIAAR
ncbi:MAG: alkaline phosphatase family protein [Anaerolineae bacterium]|nr:alkaline phosphatase family protein [Anaerolineae bacterium]